MRQGRSVAHRGWFSEGCFVHAHKRPPRGDDGSSREAIGVLAPLGRRCSAGFNCPSRGSSKPACGQLEQGAQKRDAFAQARSLVGVGHRAGHVVGGKHAALGMDVGGTLHGGVAGDERLVGIEEQPLSVRNERKARQSRRLLVGRREAPSMQSTRPPAFTGSSPSFTFTGTCPQMMREVAGSMPKSRKMPSTTASSSSSE